MPPSAIRCLTIVALIAAFPAPLAAAGEGALKISILKADGIPLDSMAPAWVSIRTQTEDSGGLASQSDGNGNAYFYKLAPGLYTIRVEARGYQTSLLRTDVRSDQVSHLKVALKPQDPLAVSVKEVTDVLDTTSITSGVQIPPDLIYDLPMGSRLVDKAQFAAGVYQSPASAGFLGSQGLQGDPALATSLTRDYWGGNSYSSNNYLFDGVDVADPMYGCAAFNPMDDLLADIDVRAGGVSAEYQAKSGLFLSATTRSGGNAFHGSLSAFSAPASLRAATKPGRPWLEESTGATSLVLDGPVMKDKLWFVFAAGQSSDGGRITLPEGVATFSGENRPFTVNDAQTLFGKLTWQIDPANRLVGEFYSEWKASNDGVDRTHVTSWVNAFKTGGAFAQIWYSLQLPGFIGDFRLSRDRQRNLALPLSGPEPTTTIEGLAPLTPAQSQFGASTLGTRNQNTTRTDARVDFLVPLGIGPTSHTLKFGIEGQRTELFTDIYQNTIYRDIAQPLTGGQILGNNLTTLPYLWDGLLASINANPNAIAAISPGASSVGLPDLAAYLFNVPDPNHPGAYLVERETTLLRSNPSVSHWTSTGFYVQDYLTWGRLTLSPGFRVDSYRIVNDQGQAVWSEDRTLAPRVGLAWDPAGDARSKVYAYFGRYFNPMVGDAISLATFTKSTGGTEQALIANQWLDVAVIPPTSTPASTFQDGMKMPYTDEIQAGFEHLARNGDAVMTFSAVATYRQDKRIIEGVDPSTYGTAQSMADRASIYWNITTPTPAQARLLSLIGSLAIPLASLHGGGYTGAQAQSDEIQVFVNMPGAWRTYRSIDLSMKRESTRSLLFMSVSRVDAEGSSMETSGLETPTGYNPPLDPRLPWMHGHLDGSLDWMAKAYGSLRFDNGLRAGILAHADSGFHYTPTLAAGFGAVVLDVPSDPAQLASFHVGGKMTPRRYGFDINLEKRWPLGGGREFWTGANFANVFNNQNGTALAEGVNFRMGVAPGQPFLFNPPRTISVIAKVRF